jgi:hypothetical protein
LLLKLAVYSLRVMLASEKPREEIMSKHHAIYMRVTIKKQDAASPEPELRRWTDSH